jgi:hypothetical protein
MAIGDGYSHQLWLANSIVNATQVVPTAGKEFPDWMTPASRLWTECATRRVVEGDEFQGSLEANHQELETVQRDWFEDEGRHQ